MRKNVIRLTESQLRTIVKSSIQKIYEEYNRWFQTEENDIPRVFKMIRELNPKLDNLDSLSPEQLWEVVRQLAYINHSAFKIKPGMYDKFPDERLENNDFRMNKVIYSFKIRALEKLINNYIKRGYDVASDENQTIIAFREPTTGVRQITFHMGKDNKLAQSLERHNATWDGVRQAHHYTDDNEYNSLRKK